jgi:mannose-6-phosphate isomerase
MDQPTAPAIPTLPALRTWLLHRAIPLWLAHGIDQAAGGFHEALAPDTYACDAPFRRLRVVTRQIVVFSRAQREGVAHAAQAVEHGIDFLARHAAQPEGGYAWRFDLTNRAIDTTRDFYDHAFVLLALAEAAAILPAAPLRRQALALLAFIETHMLHPVAGWVEGIPPSLPRRQNPHMHFLEALLAAYEVFGDEIFLDRARDVVQLFLNRLFDEETGALPEFFADQLTALRQGGAFVTEPGHHCEWAALLQNFSRQTDPDPRCTVAAKRLLAFADAHGLHPVTGDLIDTVASDGTVLAYTARLWPQTERLRVVHLFQQPESSRSRAIGSVAAFLHPDGLWHERRDATGRFQAGPSPASSLYHLATGILDGARGPSRAA